MTVTFQEGFGAFGATGNIPTLMNPAGAGNDWIVQYIMAPFKPVRLRSLMIHPLGPLNGSQNPGSVSASYFIAIGPINNNPQLQATQPVPAALFTANPTLPFIPSLDTFFQNQYTCIESGLASMNPWFQRTFSDREIVAIGNFQIVVAVTTPFSMGVAPAILTNTPLFLSVLGYDEAIDEFRQRNDPALGKWPVG